ncbi:hypothetical protein F5X68DRAFT_68576 [Plectosphaerella plurivora]|uniref:Uncharacterized protein n=1 Tax=Plectosphaerella plurivora TaxID=936078 RepID=A0A9P8VEZ7_9PEZI|nr:hypothetical protein F5X68DRAFT_68576 [Plectosphaerella plurivora]
MAPIADASLTAGRALVRRAADALPHLMAREKPVDTKKMTGIIVGVVLGTLILVTVTVALFLHRRKVKQDRKEDAALDMELDGEFDDYPINQPRPTRTRQHRQPGQSQEEGQMYRKPSVVPEDPNEAAR